MAIYSDLPLYKASYDLTLEMFKLVKDFEREYKYTIGESLKERTVELIVLIYRANAVRDKLKVIVSAREKIEVIRLMVRLTKDLKQISIRKFVSISKGIEAVSRQLAGWGNSLKPVPAGIVRRQGAGKSAV
ncbi:MAG: four helix bundle protein [Candidatus Pacebacteria bacterium]|nr:four helix bundle protein [Candidatus Paceibacterota bacterium]